MRVLICGDRDWQDAKLIYRSMKELTADDTVVEGEGRGADVISRVIADLRGIPVEKFPADWCDSFRGACQKQHNHVGIRAGVLRNQAMLSTNPDAVWAFHDNLAGSKGTKHMVGLALSIGTTVRLFGHAFPQGKVIGSLEEA